MSTKALQDELIDRMRAWQKVEDAAVLQTAKVMSMTENPLLRTVMEIINRDSRMHYRVQGLVADSFEKTPVNVSPDDLAAVWDEIEAHIKTEMKMLSAVKEALESIKGKKMVVAEYLLNYLMIDEDKHNALLDSLDKIKSGMTPS